MADTKPRFKVYRPQAMLDTLKRLNGQNLENQGLNNMTEAFQSFMTRTKFFGTSSLRRTWSHSAVEFMKYRRLLPMLVADEHDLGSAFDTFDLYEGTSMTSRVSKNDRKVTVSNVSSKATISQLQSFFSKFGPVHSCSVSGEDRRQSMYATISRNSKKLVSVNVTFKNELSALRALSAAPQELRFYSQVMTVAAYIPKKRTTSHSGEEPSSSNPIVIGNEEGKLSRSSSALSIGSTSTTTSQFPLDELPQKALYAVFCNLGPLDRIRLERTNKSWLEAAAKSWVSLETLCFKDDVDLKAFFSHNRPLRNSHLNSFLLRCCFHLKRLDLSNTKHLLDDKAIEQIAQLCINLEELDISGIQASADALRSLSESLTHLNSVSYREMHSSNDKCFWYLFKSNGRAIKYVDLRGCTRLQGRCFKLFGVALEQVYLDGCSLIDDSVIDEMCSRSKNVNTLSLNGCYRISDQSLSVISRHLSHLKSFSLCGETFNKITSEGLTLISRVSSLTYISFDFNPNVTNEVIDRICVDLKSLESLSLAFAGTDKSIDNNALANIANLTELQELDLSGLAALTSKVFQKICKSCTKLRHITVKSCIYIGDEGVNALQGLEHLESVDFSGCILISSTSIQELIKHFNLDRTPNGHDITVTVGGTICEAHQLRYLHSRVYVDFDDNSVLSLDTARRFISGFTDSDMSDQLSDGEISDDGFGMLSAHRSFVADALTGEEESPLENDKSMLEWAEKEAKELGLLK